MTLNTDSTTTWRGVWVVAEQRALKLETVVLELLGEGRRLADKLGGELSAVLLGHGVRELCDELIAHGADRVYVAQDPRLQSYQCAAFAPVLQRLIKEERPEIVLFGATSIGRDLAPRVAANLRTGLSADCVALDIGSHGKLLQIVPAFGGKVMATIITPERQPQMATVRPGVMKALQRRVSPGEVRDVDVSLPADLKLFDVITELEVSHGEEGPDLDEADTIVSGGAGVVDREGWDLLMQLADTIHGAVGGTRPAMDDGWIAEHQMIGQSGNTYAPRLYIAVGISGEMQHTVGIQGAQVVVAINADPEAVMISGADYAIVGDYREILPRLIERIKGVH